jgi:hypothetical protein
MDSILEDRINKWKLIDFDSENEIFKSPTNEIIEVIKKLMVIDKSLTTLLTNHKLLMNQIFTQIVLKCVNSITKTFEEFDKIKTLTGKKRLWNDLLQIKKHIQKWNDKITISVINFNILEEKFNKKFENLK